MIGYCLIFLLFILMTYYISFVYLFFFFHFGFFILFYFLSLLFLFFFRFVFIDFFNWFQLYLMKWLWMTMTKLRIRYTSAFGPWWCHICYFMLDQVRVCILLFGVNISGGDYFFILSYILTIILFDATDEWVGDIFAFIFFIFLIKIRRIWEIW